MLRELTCPADRDDVNLGDAMHLTDGVSLAVVRIAVGLIAVVSMVRLHLTGWLDELVIAPQHHLRYPGLAWIPIPSETGVRLLALAAGLAALSVAIGLGTRAAAGGFLVAFGWLETIEATTYLNHYWLLFSLFLVLMLVPSDAAWSVAAWRHGPRRVPMWAVWAVRAQVGLVYVFAGVAKLHRDWLVWAEPLATWLPSRSDLAVVGSLLEAPWTAHAASVAGAVFDLAVVPLLVWKRSRPWAYAALVVFHLSTALLLPPIGLFPLLMTSVATVFFEPGWARRGAGSTTQDRSTTRGFPRPAAVLITVWLLIQVTLPLRHWSMPGDARWTGEGYRFAWNVVAVEKSGSVAFVLDDGDSTILVDPAEWFTGPQLRVASGEPDLIIQMANVIAAGWPTAEPPSVYAEAWLSINGRPAERLIDPSVDLAGQSPMAWREVVTDPPAGLGW